MNEMGVVDGPERVGECNELWFAKQVFLFFFIDDQGIRPQSVPHPLSQG